MITNAQEPAMLVIEEWQEFLDAGGLTRKAGCCESDLPFMALKELVDNAFEYDGASFKIEGDSTYVIEDWGPGLSREEIEHLFSIRRPMNSSKRWRRAGRGALGNGLRVAVGALRLVEADLSVASRDGTYRVTVDEIGRTSTKQIGEAREVGTEIRIALPEPLDKEEESTLQFCTLAPGPVYDGPANAHWFGMMAFRDLVQNLCPHMTIAEFKAQFGVEDARQKLLGELDDEQTKRLHGGLKARCPRKVELPGMGEEIFSTDHYHRKVGSVSIKGAKISATVEAWVTADRQSSSNYVCLNGLFMNRTWSLEKPHGVYRDGIRIMGCGLNARAKAYKATYDVIIAISTPHFPMTSDGKKPDLSPFADLIEKVVWKAGRAAYDAAPKPAPEPKAPKSHEPEKPPRVSIKKAAFDVLEDAVAHASSNFSHKITARQVYYAVRDRVTRLHGTEITDTYFTQTLLPEYIATEEPTHWPLINFDARGSASEPHDGEKKIPLSTEGLITFKHRFEAQQSAEIKFGAVLYIEKEQFGEILAPIANEFDILLVEAKGQPTTAERELLQWAAAKNLPVLVFADLDVSGLQISEGLRLGSKRHPERIPAERIGLRLKHVHEFQLNPEPYTPSKAQLTWLEKSEVYHRERAFVLRQRCELNHLTTQQMMNLLRGELEAFGIQKLRPSTGQIEQAVQAEARLAGDAEHIEPIKDRMEAEIAEAKDRIQKKYDDEFQEASGKVEDFVRSVEAASDLEEINRLIDLEFQISPKQFWPEALNKAIWRSGIITNQ